MTSVSAPSPAGEAPNNPTSRTPPAPPAPATGWSPTDAVGLYGLDSWGAGYVAVNDAGHLMVLPRRDGTAPIDLHALVNGLAERGVDTPVLLRFSDIVRDRLTVIREAFDHAIAQEEYRGDYACVYPIKVNQQRHVLEEVRDIGAELGFGLEVGSKPELLAVLGMTADHPDMPIVCNGFKDDEYIETVVLATKLGRTIYTVVEKSSELGLLISHAERYGVKPKIGIRAKLSAPGAGRWESSGGSRSKFGLFISEILAAVEELRGRGLLDCLNMLHFHLGSQICDIRNVKNAVTELAHIYAELHRLGAAMTTIDIGGGLGVDYDGSRSAGESSMNYTVDEYAADVVYRIKSVCDEADVPHPRIISESGRAMVAYASVLVFDVVGSARFEDLDPPDELDAIAATSDDEVPQPVVDLFAAWESTTTRPVLEVYHDAIQARDEIVSLFSLGYLSLPMRGIAERLFWSIGHALLQRIAAMPDPPDELLALPEILADHYFCNFSIFQSMPDAWAVDQLFPICPVARLDERPTRRAVLADITCDSDGRIDRFVGPEEPERTLPLHELHEGQPYRLAAFLVGAYQEILGDLHNLLGDTNAVHVGLGPDGMPVIEEVIRGDTVRDVLGYVQIDHRELRRQMRRDAERAVHAGTLTPAESGALMRFYEHGLDGYTYLEE